MALEDSVGTFTKHTSGGSPYLEAYAGGDAIKYREGLLNQAINVAQEERAQKSFDLANLREARIQRQQDLEMDYKLRAEARQAKMDEIRIREAERKEEEDLHEMETASEAADLYSSIMRLRPTDPDYYKKVDEISKTDKFKSVMLSPRGNVVNSLLEQKNTQFAKLREAEQKQMEEQQKKAGSEAYLSQQREEQMMKERRQAALDYARLNQVPYREAWKTLYEEEIPKTASPVATPLQQPMPQDNIQPTAQPTTQPTATKTIMVYDPETGTLKPKE